MNGPSFNSPTIANKGKGKRKQSEHGKRVKKSCVNKRQRKIGENTSENKVKGKKTVGRKGKKIKQNLYESKPQKMARDYGIQEKENICPKNMFNESDPLCRFLIENGWPIEDPIFWKKVRLK